MTSILQFASLLLEDLPSHHQRLKQIILLIYVEDGVWLNAAYVRKRLNE